MRAYVDVFLGAGLGGALRHAVNVTTLALFGPAYPFGTLCVNVVGGFVMGALAEWFAQKFDPGQQWRLFLTTGILGGFTTFSAFSLDSVLLIERSSAWTAAGYIVLSVAGSIAALAAGLMLVRHVV